MTLELKNIRMSYSNARDEVTYLLRGVDLNVEEGKVTALVGGNGTGKTTLFNIISGFEKGFQGSVLLDGKDITREPAHRIVRMGVGRLFQERQLMEDLTLLENLMIADDNLTGENPLDVFFRPRRVSAREAERKRKAVEVLTRVFGEGNTYLDRLDWRASEFSYGEQRLIALARLRKQFLHAFVGELLLLDEPTSGVNPQYIDAIARLIRDMASREGLSVLVIEHNLEFVRETADCCHYLSDGVFLKSGNPADVLNAPEVLRDYAVL